MAYPDDAGPVARTGPRGNRERAGGREVGTRREAELEREIAQLERTLGQMAMIADLRSKALQRLT
jgi:hypothetical protein